MELLTLESTLSQKESTREIKLKLADNLQNLIVQCLPLTKSKLSYYNNYNKRKLILNLERIKNIFKVKGIKPTYQRLKILEYMYKNPHAHPSAEMIFEAILRDIPAITMATIHSSLMAMLSNGFISVITPNGNDIRYDAVVLPHQHLLCKKCGKIVDIDLKCQFGLNKKENIKGHQVEGVHGFFQGICEECNDNLKSNKLVG